MSIVQFPQTEDSRQRLHNIKVLGQQQTQSQTQKVIYTPVYLHGFSELCGQFRDFNDTMKYVTDGLYAIALEIKEIKGKSLWSRLLDFFIGDKEKIS